MTVQNNVPLNQYVGDAVNDTFAFTFQILDNQFLKVTVDGVFQTENFDYTVENISSIGGDVVFINTPGNDKRPGVGAEVAL